MSTTIAVYFECMLWTITIHKRAFLIKRFEFIYIFAQPKLLAYATTKRAGRHIPRICAYRQFESLQRTPASTKSMSRRRILELLCICVEQPREKNIESKHRENGDSVHPDLARSPCNSQTYISFGDRACAEATRRWIPAWGLHSHAAAATINTRDRVGQDTRCVWARC